MVEIGIAGLRKPEFPPDGSGKDKSDVWRQKRTAAVQKVCQGKVNDG
jgi:hypothetical protein